MDEKMNEVLKGIYKSLTDEQKEKAKTCRTTGELMELAGEWGIELPDETLDAVAGGGCGSESCDDCKDRGNDWGYICWELQS